MRKLWKFSVAFAVAMCLCGSVKAEVAPELSSGSCEEASLSVVSDDEISDVGERSVALKPVLNANSLVVRDDARVRRDRAEWAYWASCPIVNLTNEVASSYPKLNAALQEMNDYNSSKMEQHEEKWVAEMAEMAASSPNRAGYFRSSSYSSDLLLARIDSRVVSLLTNTSSVQMGGVNPGGFIKAWNFDVATGKHLTLQDVVNDISALFEVIRRELPKQVEYASIIESDRISGWEHERASRINVDQISDVLFSVERAQNCWHFTKNGIVIVFNPYELSCGADGRFEYALNYADHPELFRKEYSRDMFNVPAVSLKGDTCDQCSVLYDKLCLPARGKWRLHSYVCGNKTYNASQNGVKGSLSISTKNKVALGISGDKKHLPQFQYVMKDRPFPMAVKGWFEGGSCLRFLYTPYKNDFYAKFTDNQDRKLRKLDVVMVAYSAKNGASNTVKLHFVPW